jgi:hypothetical protein
MLAECSCFLRNGSRAGKALAQRFSPKKSCRASRPRGPWRKGVGAESGGAVAEDSITTSGESALDERVLEGLEAKALLSSHDIRTCKRDGGEKD